MINSAYNIRCAIKEWKSTGILRRDTGMIKDIYETYKNIYIYARNVSEYDLMWKDAMKELDTLERIMNARGIDIEKES